MSAPNPKMTACQVSDSPRAFRSSGKRRRAAPANTAPSTVRVPSVTTITIQKSPAPTVKLAS